MEVRTLQSGRLEDVSPLDLLQSLGIYRRAGHVVLTHDHGRSELWFEAGEIIDARSGALRGAAAVHRLVTHERGEYSIEVTGLPHPRTIERGATWLVFEAARRLDEGQRLRARLPAPDAVLVLEPGASPGPSAEHERVDAWLAAGCTLGEVLERSALGELETLEWIARLVDAGRLRPTGEARSPGPAARHEAGAGPSWALALDQPSQPFVPSPSFAGYEGLDDEASPRRRWWIHAAAAAVVAALVVALALGRDDASPAKVAASAGPVAVIDATRPPVAATTEPAPPERPVAVGASADEQAGARLDPAQAAAPSRSTAPRGRARSPSARQPERSPGPRVEAGPAARDEPGGEPAAVREDAGALLVAARRAYAAGDGATAYRLASRSQQLEPSGDTAEVMTLAACEQARPGAAAEALRAVPLLRRASVRAACKQGHGVRIKVARGR